MPLLAVIKPIESTLVTSSYVRVPPTVTFDAVIFPVMFTLPVPVMLLEFKSKFPPNCGVVSSTTLEILPAI